MKIHLICEVVKTDALLCKLPAGSRDVADHNAAAHFTYYCSAGSWYTASATG
jgi:hypothetical protein